MDRLEVKYVWQLELSQRSAWARFAGMMRLALQHLRDHLFENVLLTLTIALGVGFLVGLLILSQFFVTAEGPTLVGHPLLLRTVTVRTIPSYLAPSNSLNHPTVSSLPTVSSPRDGTFPFREIDGDSAAVHWPGGLDADFQLTVDDLLAARRRLEHIRLVVSEGVAATLSVSAVDESLLPPEMRGVFEAFGTIRVQTVTPDHLEYRGDELIAGRWITWADYEAGAMVLVLDERDVSVLFPGIPVEAVVGRTLGTDNASSWHIVGIVRPRDMGASSGRNDEDKIMRGYVAHTAVDPLENGGRMTLTEMGFVPDDDVSLYDFAYDLEAFFADRFEDRRVLLDIPASVWHQWVEEKRPAALGMTGLFLLAILVVVINVFHVRMSQIVRRRRMTAISKALGASRRSIFTMVTLEMVVLGVAGGVVGLLPAYGTKVFLRPFFQPPMSAFVDAMGLNGVVLSGQDVFFCLIAGVGLSLLFGLYPAYVGASTEPGAGLKGTGSG